MIRINLLSPIDKDNFKWEKTNNLIKGCMGWMFLIEIVFLAMFFFTIEYLNIEKDSIALQLEQIELSEATREMRNIESSLALYSDKIEEISTISDEHIHWSKMLEELIKIMPDDVRIYSLSSQSVDSQLNNQKLSEEIFQIDLTGYASTRSDLLLFEDNLKKSEMFFDIEYDDFNYIDANNIDFRYSFYVNKNSILK